MFEKIFFFVFFFLFIAAHEQQDEIRENTLNEIVRKYWASYLEKIPMEKREVFERKLSSQEKKEITERLSYQCQHDTINLKFHKKLNFELQNTKQKIPPSIEKKGVTQVPIQFLTNTTYVTDTNDPLACRTVGQVVQLADSGNNYVCTSDDIQTTALQSLIRDIIGPSVLEFFADSLFIDDPSGPVQLDPVVYNVFDGECFDDVEIPESHVTVGIPDGKHYVVYFTARPCSSTGTVAYAAACNFDLFQSGSNFFFGRPLAGIVNFCPRHFVQFETSGSLFELTGAAKVGVHEFTHALGFSSNFYNSFTDSNGIRYTSNRRVECLTGTAPDGTSFSRTITKLITPRVVELARNHFNCSTLDGVELEDIGGSGTAGSHWEQRVVQTEYMAGFINPLMPVSKLTFALLEDSGYYTVDYDQAEYWVWGKDEGCDFVQGECQNTWVGKPGYFCSDSNVRVCTPDRLAKGRCNIQTYQGNLVPEYRRFINPSVGGSIISDGCTFQEGFNSADFCGEEENIPITDISEQFGNTSLCWEYKIGATGSISTINPTLACWNHRCQSGELQVYVGGQWNSCPIDGGEIVVTGLSTGSGDGKINCPRYSLVCVPDNNPTGSIQTGTNQPFFNQPCGSPTPSPTPSPTTPSPTTPSPTTPSPTTPSPTTPSPTTPSPTTPSPTTPSPTTPSPTVNQGSSLFPNFFYVLAIWIFLIERLFN